MIVHSKNNAKENHNTIGDICTRRDYRLIRHTY